MNRTPPLSKRGIVVTIEGGDGVGKSTQIELVRNRLIKAGYAVALFDFPSKVGSPIGELIGDFLRGEFGEVTPEFLSIAFSVDRLHAKAALEAALESGSVVLCDRYVLSNIAFQSAKIENAERRERIRALIEWIEFELFKLPRPDVEVVLVANDAYFEDGRHLARDVDDKRSYALGKADIHESSLKLQLAVNQIYRALAGNDGIEIVLGDVRRASDDIVTEIWARMGQRLEEKHG